MVCMDDGLMTKDDPIFYDLSIVVVSFNTRKMTEECLHSICLNSTDLSVQIVVVDNNSQDGSAQMVENEFPTVVLVKNHENMGFAAANNQGFKYCSAEYILLLNSDTLILGDVLKKSLTLLMQDSSIGAMACRVLNSDKTVQRTCFGYPTLMRLLSMTLGLDRILGGYFDQYLLRSWKRDNEREIDTLTGCYLMLPTTILEMVGRLDEQFFFYGEETDWCRRIREAGSKVIFSPVGEIVHHGGGSSKKLRYQADVMLTAATVRLHRKYGGIFKAVIAYIILFTFNSSRAILWGVGSLLKKSYRKRASHFLKVVRYYRDCWPTKNIDI